jgi:hypothetical protein
MATRIALAATVATQEKEGDSDEKTTQTAKRRRSTRVLWIPAHLLFVYATTYLLMMNPKAPVWDPVTWKPAYESSFLFAPTSTPPGLHNCHLPLPCWANRIFWPMDYLIPPLIKSCNGVFSER